MKREYQPPPEVLALIRQKLQGEPQAAHAYPTKPGGLNGDKHLQRQPAVYSPDDYVALPLYDVRAAAGGGVVPDTENVVDFLHFKKAWLRTELRSSPDDLYLIYVDGESMEPTLCKGDVILVNHRDKFQGRDGGIYVLRLDGALLVKRLQRKMGGIIKVTSDNPVYEPFEVGAQDLDRADFSIIGRVVWAGRRM
ncbi:prophage MuMc02, peptidase, family S24 [Methylococcus capsulatus str. Bath]|uniref:Prophage MuMc02, peptidase, family S24 n=2 Tax=Methylococcaceae TaxID=403 RepID=Q602V0_METCA|nr:prophage MuMc02, peptidase, family S24 [Methylococcus capsulatus str. Bath]